MKRKTKTLKSKNKNPIAVLTGDWHLRDTQPIARTDDFWEAQWNAVEYVLNLAWELRRETPDFLPVPVICSGDLFDNWKPSPMLLAKAISVLSEYNKDAGFPLLKTVYGNHDLPQHNLELKHKTGIEVLEQAGVIDVLPGTHWGQDLTPVDFSGFLLGVWHVMTWKGELPHPDSPAPDAYKLLGKYTGVLDMLLTGHNHKPFVAKKEGAVLVNPGSLTAQTADQEDFYPRVYVWYRDNTVEPHYIPGGSNITREHVERKKERDERISAFIEKLEDTSGGGLSLESNLEAVLEQAGASEGVRNLVYESIEK